MRKQYDDRLCELIPNFYEINNLKTLDKFKAVELIRKIVSLPLCVPFKKLKLTDAEIK